MPIASETTDTECQTNLRCTPHIVHGGDVITVQGDAMCQTVIALDSKISDTILYEELAFQKQEIIEWEAIRILELPRIPRLQFVLPQSEDASENEVIISEESLVHEEINVAQQTDIKASQLENGQLKSDEQLEITEKKSEILDEKPEILDEDLEITEVVVDQFQEQTTETEEQLINTSETSQPKSAEEKPESIEDKSESIKEKSKSVEGKSESIEKISESNLESINEKLKHDENLVKISVMQTKTSILKKSRKKTVSTDDAYCQTILMVFPHILSEGEKALITTSLSVQTSVTCAPECSLSDIIPKLKVYLVHEGKSEAAYDRIGDSEANKSVLDIIKDIIDDVENYHAHLFDPIYKASEISETDLKKDDDSICSCYDDQSVDKFISNLADTLDSCVCRVPGFKINVKVNNIYADLNPNEQQINLTHKSAVTTLIINVAPGIQSIDIRPQGNDNYQVAINPVHKCRAFLAHDEENKEKIQAIENPITEFTEKKEAPTKDAEQNEVSAENIEQNELPVEDDQQNEVPAEDVEQNEVSAEYVEQNEVSVEDVEQSELPIEDVQQNEVPAEDVAQNEVSAEYVEQNEVSAEDVEQNEVPAETMEQKANNVIEELPVDNGEQEIETEVQKQIESEEIKAEDILVESKIKEVAEQVEKQKDNEGTETRTSKVKYLKCTCAEILKQKDKTKEAIIEQIENQESKVEKETKTSQVKSLQCTCAAVLGRKGKEEKKCKSLKYTSALLQKENTCKQIDFIDKQSTENFEQIHLARTKCTQTELYNDACKKQVTFYCKSNPDFKQPCSASNETKEIKSLQVISCRSNIKNQTKEDKKQSIINFTDTHQTQTNEEFVNDGEMKDCIAQTHLARKQIIQTRFDDSEHKKPVTCHCKSATVLKKSCSGCNIAKDVKSCQVLKNEMLSLCNCSINRQAKKECGKHVLDKMKQETLANFLEYINSNYPFKCQVDENANFDSFIQEDHPCGMISIPVKFMISANDLACKALNYNKYKLEKKISFVFENCKNKNYFEPYMDDLQEIQDFPPKLVYNSNLSVEHNESYVTYYAVNDNYTSNDSFSCRKSNCLSKSAGSLYDTCSEQLNNKSNSDNIFNYVTLPPKGTINIAALNKKDETEDEDIWAEPENILSEEKNPIEKTSFVYNKYNIENEPYAENLLQNYDGINISPCTSQTEIPWNMFVLPDTHSIKIRKLEKLRPRTCACNPRKKSLDRRMTTSSRSFNIMPFKGNIHNTYSKSSVSESSVKYICQKPDFQLSKSSAVSSKHSELVRLSLRSTASKDPVLAAVKACEEQLKPIKKRLEVMHQKLKELNIPEIDCILQKNHNSSQFSSSIYSNNYSHSSYCSTPPSKLYSKTTKYPMQSRIVDYQKIPLSKSQYSDVSSGDSTSTSYHLNDYSELPKTKIVPTYTSSRSSDFYSSQDSSKYSRSSAMSSYSSGKKKSRVSFQDTPEDAFSQLCTHCGKIKLETNHYASHSDSGSSSYKSRSVSSDEWYDLPTSRESTKSSRTNCPVHSCPFLNAVKSMIAPEGCDQNTANSNLQRLRYKLRGRAFRNSRKK